MEYYAIDSKLAVTGASDDKDKNAQNCSFSFDVIGMLGCAKLILPVQYDVRAAMTL